jgi:hypothetical protein
VLSDAVGFEVKFWDPRLAKWSGFMEFGRSQADFHWDPGSSDVLLSIRFMRHSADFIPAHHHELHMAWPCFMLFTQQKGSGTSRLASEIMWVVAVVSTNCINSGFCQCLGYCSAAIFSGIVQCVFSGLSSVRWLCAEIISSAMEYYGPVCFCFFLASRCRNVRIVPNALLFSHFSLPPLR